MANTSIFGREEARFLAELIREKVDFMIVGLSAAALQGAPVVTQDIDLWFRDLAHPGIKKALKKVKGSYLPPMAQNPPMFAGSGVNLFDIVVHMHGLESFDQEKVNTLRAPLGRLKVPVLKLERIIASKKATNREKDRLAIRVLSDTLRLVNSEQPPRRNKTNQR